MRRLCGAAFSEQLFQILAREALRAGGDLLRRTLRDDGSAAGAAGTLAGDKLAQCQKLHRNAQFYWDFVMVENGDGAHNSKLSDETLDKSEKAVDEALALLA